MAQTVFDSTTTKGQALTGINGNFTECYTVVSTARAANLVYCGPATGSAAAPTFRALVAADIPALNYSTFSGAYADLSGKPTLFDGTYAALTGKPDLSLFAPLASPTFTGTVTVSLLASGPNFLPHGSGNNYLRAASHFIHQPNGSTGVALVPDTNSLIVKNGNGADVVASMVFIFPPADPHLAGVWWDNAGTLTRSTG